MCASARPRETRYGGSVWSWELKFGVSRVGNRGQTMNLLVHLVCSYYGTRPRPRMRIASLDHNTKPRMHGPDSRSAHLCQVRHACTLYSGTYNTLNKSHAMHCYIKKTHKSMHNTCTLGVVARAADRARSEIANAPPATLRGMR